MKIITIKVFEKGTNRVITPEYKELKIECLVHLVEKQEDLCIEEEFYKEYSIDKEIPKFPHNELELSEIQISNFFESFDVMNLHIHKTKEDKMFLCYLSRIDDNDIGNLLKIFAIGSMYHMLSGTDFVVSYPNALSISAEEFLSILSENGFSLDYSYIEV